VFFGISIVYICITVHVRHTANSHRAQHNVLTVRMSACVRFHNEESIYLLTYLLRYIDT